MKAKNNNKNTIEMIMNGAEFLSECKMLKRVKNGSKRAFTLWLHGQHCVTRTINNLQIQFCFVSVCEGQVLEFCFLSRVGFFFRISQEGKKNENSK